MSELQPYDAVLLVSFGGPEGPDEVLPFMQRVTAGRGIPEDRLREVSRHYLDHFDGVSPINAANRQLLDDLASEFAHRGWDLPIEWGNRNAPPFLPEALQALVDAGHRRVLAVLTSAYPSYSSCRQYRENLHDALAEVPDPPQVDLVTPYAHRQGFARAQADALLAGIERARQRPRVVFVTHSIPESMDSASGPDGGAYLRWHLDLAGDIARRAGEALGAELTWELAFCSRSGPPTVPWQEPDINDRLRELAEQGERSVVVLPFGFISDHMEVVYDLDIEAAATAAEVGMDFVRAATVGTDPRFVAMLCDALADRARVARGSEPRPDLIAGGQTWTPCAANCCANQRSPERASLAT
ncbi:ferrochelatase [Enemella sp. A6]|uniref:ferrochelatase n=1 Tax=Enemella sp. A6 TaxID=3440152 RepID=UPI003EB83B66